MALQHEAGGERLGPQLLVLVGMTKGEFAAAVFCGAGKNICCVVHGGDFTFLGWQKDLDDAAALVKQHDELKAHETRPTSGARRRPMTR